MPLSVQSISHVCVRVTSFTYTTILWGGHGDYLISAETEAQDD